MIAPTSPSPARVGTNRLNPWSSRALVCSSLATRLSVPITTEMRRTFPRTAVAARHQPAAFVCPVLRPSRPSYLPTRPFVLYKMNNGFSRNVSITVEVHSRTSGCSRIRVCDAKAMSRAEAREGRSPSSRRQPVGVCEVAVRHADLLGAIIHQLGEGGLGSGDKLGHRDARVVARGDRDRLQHHLERVRLALCKVDLGSADRGRATACPHRVVQTHLARFDSVHGNEEGHDLDEAGRLISLICVLFKEDLSGVGVDENGRPRRNVKDLGLSADTPGKEKTADESERDQGLGKASPSQGPASL